LEKEQLLGKIVTLSVSKYLEAESKLPSLPRLILEGLFMGEKIPRVAAKLAPLNVGPVNTVTTNGGLISPQSPTRAGLRFIDPSLVSKFMVKPSTPKVLIFTGFSATAQTYVISAY
jgi:hypothetical protein